MTKRSWEEAKTADPWMGGSGLERMAECEERASHKKNGRLAAGSHDPQTCLLTVDIEGRRATEPESCQRREGPRIM